MELLYNVTSTVGGFGLAYALHVMHSCIKRELGRQSSIFKRSLPTIATFNSSFYIVPHTHSSAHCGVRSSNRSRIHTASLFLTCPSQSPFFSPIPPSRPRFMTAAECIASAAYTRRRVHIVIEQDFKKSEFQYILKNVSRFFD